MGKGKIKLKAGLSHNPDHRANREVVGPHSGPYGSRPDRRVRGADRAPLAEVMIKALKAELPGSHWSKTMLVWRYRAEAFGQCTHTIT